MGSNYNRTIDNELERTLQHVTSSAYLHRLFPHYSGFSQCPIIPIIIARIIAAGLHTISSSRSVAAAYHTMYPIMSPLGCSGTPQETETEVIPTWRTLTLTGTDGTVNINNSYCDTITITVYLLSSSVLK